MVIKGGLIMKKITVLFAALAAAFAVSCNKEAALQENAPAMKKVTISASYGEDTKTT